MKQPPRLVRLVIYAYSTQASAFAQPQKPLSSSWFYLLEREPQDLFRLVFLSVSSHGDLSQNRGPPNTGGGVQLACLPLSYCGFFRLLHDWIYDFVHRHHRCSGIFRKCLWLRRDERFRVVVDQSQRRLTVPGGCLLWFTDGICNMPLPW